jgi:hypothetical protein
VLPPYNNVWATLIRRGEEPGIVHSGFTVGYEIVDNTYSVGKTDFWTYVQDLFGVSPADNIGLAGAGLAGDLTWMGDHFEVIGLPLTPFTDSDLTTEQPYQLGDLTASDGRGVVATTQIVVPVSNEMMCSDCHRPEGGETVEQAILRLHDDENDTDLLSNRPVLCASCHGSNALGMAGDPELPSLSLAMHRHHAEETIAECYQCHPGPQTQCLRDVMSQQYGMTCEDCHGTLAEVAQSIENGREPWLEEPRCGSCHGETYGETPGTLYRNATNGHHGLYCTTCHGSPHAILPSREERDNRQNIELQGHSGTLNVCAVCHAETPDEPGPHGISGVPSGK